MPLPPNLEWDDRLAPYTHPDKGPGFYFMCQREGHRDRVKKHIRFLPGKKTDAKEDRDAHDVEHHNSRGRSLGAQPAKDAEIATLCRDFMNYSERLELRGQQDPQTTRHYSYTTDKYIIPGFAAVNVRMVSQLTRGSIDDFVEWCRENRKGQGKTIIKALSALRTIIRWEGGLATDWQIPTKLIAAKAQEKRDIDAGTARRLIAAMPAGSIEEAVSHLKAGTGARDIEIYRALPEEFEWNVPIDTDDGEAVFIGVWEPVLRSKGQSSQKVVRHVYALTPDVVAKVQPWVAAAAPGEPVFRTDECRDVEASQMREWMRARIRAASKRAGIVTVKKYNRWIGRGGKGKKEYETTIGAIDSIAPIRHEVVTIVKENRSLEKAAEQAGHVDTSTTRKWYVKDRRTKNQLLDRYRSAAILHREMPLGGEASTIH